MAEGRMFVTTDQVIDVGRYYLRVCEELRTTGVKCEKKMLATIHWQDNERKQIPLT
jgi:hypothetical protein